MATIEHADIVNWLRGRQWLFENGFLPKYHAILCDPPYALEFMGNAWDKYTPEDYQQWATEWGRLALSAVYPGAIGLFFGGTRTFHRLAVGLENAGWQVVDCISYIYASGFPKSLDISKAIDKAAGAEREVIGEYQWPDGKPRNTKKHKTERNGIYSNIKTNDELNDRSFTSPATLAAAQWEGRGTALKPAYEACLVCRAPRAGNTFASLALEYGTGSFDIDAGRIAGDKGNGHWGGNQYIGSESFGQITGNGYKTNQSSLGRFPANVLFAHAAACTDTRCVPECPVKQLGDMSGERPSGSGIKNPAGTIIGNGITRRNEISHYDNAGIGGDTGTAARFFFAAKAATFERLAGLDERSVHPTMKPIQLTEYLARFILPPPLDTPRRLLIPFAGVASEMVGAVLAGWDEVTGIEREAQYIPIAEARLAWWGQFKTYDKAKEKYDSIHAGEAVEQALINAGQLSLFAALDTR